jgi:SAM-dependent methyltransferase
MDQRDSFNTVAALYGEVRPGYPAALFDDLWALAGLVSSARVLEVGCGAGQATGDLAARSAEVVALDPGPALIDQARARVGAANVAYVVSGLEAYEPAAESFDLVASAQAWHWIAPDVAFAKAAQALKPGAALAVFGHTPMPPPEPYAEAFKPVYEACWPGVWGLPPPQAAYLADGPFPGMFDASGLFGPVSHRGYAWTWTVDGATLGKYLRTDSSYRALAEEPRQRLFEGLQAAVERLGDRYAMPWETHLYLAAKAPR